MKSSARANGNSSGMPPSQKEDADMLPLVNKRRSHPASDNKVALRMSFGKHLLLLAGGLLLLLVSMQSMYGSYALARSGMQLQQKDTSFDPNLARLQKRGWMQSVVDLRIQIAKASRNVQKLDSLSSTQKEYARQIEKYQNYTLNIDPLVQTLKTAIDTVGVRGLLFDILNDDYDYYLYLPETPSYKCLNDHGVGNRCTSGEAWWLYHYAGAVIADHFLNNRGILWDGLTQQRIHDMADLLHEIQRFQQLPYVNGASFHAEHAIIWQYLAQAFPKLDRYPSELVTQFCRYEFANRKSSGFARTVGKGIDHECYHGFGHAMYYVVAKRQMKRDLGHPFTKKALPLPTKTPKIPAKYQIRPNSGFALDEQAMCQVWQLCKDAQRPQDDEERHFPYSRGARICLEGVVHSVRLFSDTRHDKPETIDYVHSEMMRCEREEQYKKRRWKKKQKKNKSIGDVQVLDHQSRVRHDMNVDEHQVLDGERARPPREEGHARNESDEPQDSSSDAEPDFDSFQRHG